jgi:cytochrome b561
LSEDKRPIGAEGAAPRWSPLIVGLHWLAAALILGLIALGWFMVHWEADAARRFDLYQAHKSLGFVALALFLARLVARAATRAPPPLQAMPLWEQRAAALAHGALYALALIAPLTGWLVVSSAIVAIPTRFFDLFVIPNLPGVSTAQFDAATTAHFLAVWLLAALVALHVAAALKHRLVDRDAIWSRMAPRWLGRRDG